MITGEALMGIGIAVPIVTSGSAGSAITCPAIRCERVALPGGRKSAK